MFKAKVSLYKNINWKEEKISKEFKDEKSYKKYINSNPELKNMESNLKEIKFPSIFKETKDFFEKFDHNFFWDEEIKFFEKINKDFEKFFEKNKHKKLK